MGTGSFSGVKRPGRGADHPPPYIAGVKERVGLNLYSTSGSSWPVIGSALPLQARHVTHLEKLKVHTTVARTNINFKEFIGEGAKHNCVPNKQVIKLGLDLSGAG